MHTLYRPFLEGGFAVYAILCCSVLGVPIAALAIPFARRGNRFVSIATVAAGLFTFTLGVLGYFLGMRNVYGALASVDPSQRTQILVIGQSEAMWNVICGVAGAAPQLILGIVGLLAVKRPQSPPAG